MEIIGLPVVFAFPREFSGQEFLRQKNHYSPEGNMGGKERYLYTIHCTAKGKHKIE